MKKLLSVFFVAGLSACLFAELNLKTLVNPKYYDELVSKGEVTVIHDDEADTSVLFPSDETKKIFDGSRIKKDPKGYSYFYESLYYKSKAELTGGKGTVTLEDVAKVVRSVSKMQGMTENAEKEFEGQDFDQSDTGKVIGSIGESLAETGKVIQYGDEAFEQFMQEHGNKALGSFEGNNRLLTEKKIVAR